MALRQAQDERPQHRPRPLSAPLGTPHPLAPSPSEPMERGNRRERTAGSLWLASPPFEKPPSTPLRRASLRLATLAQDRRDRLRWGRTGRGRATGGGTGSPLTLILICDGVQSRAWVPPGGERGGRSSPLGFVLEPFDFARGRLRTRDLECSGGVRFLRLAEARSGRTGSLALRPFDRAQDRFSPSRVSPGRRAVARLGRWRGGSADSERGDGYVTQGWPGVRRMTGISRGVAFCS